MCSTFKIGHISDLWTTLMHTVEKNSEILLCSSRYSKRGQQCNEVKQLSVQVPAHLPTTSPPLAKLIRIFSGGMEYKGCVEFEKKHPRRLKLITAPTHHQAPG